VSENSFCKSYVVVSLPLIHYILWSTAANYEYSDTLLDQKPGRKRGHARRRTNQRTIFYVDDNPKALRILTFALAWAGYKVVTACNAEALERMKQTSSDMVLVAYRTPQMIGSKLTRDIKQLNPEIPILLISGHTLLASEELTYVNAYVGGGATLDALLTQMRVLLTPA
jgi:CheY-like chemotaxis protein